MIERRRTEAGLVYYQSPLLDALSVPHSFSTRIGGVSLAPFDSLNLGTLSDPLPQDDNACVQENYRRLRAAIGCEDRTRCWVYQVHGAAVETITDCQPFENGPKADAMVTTDPQRVLSVKYADCVPVLISTEDGKAVAAIHSGWRGVVAGVVPAAVRELSKTSGYSPSNFVAAIGPCIGFAHFEVGAEVIAAFRESLGASAPVREQGEKGYIDLQAAVHQQLRACGIAAGNIDGNDRCTFRDKDEFFSHRRDHGITGRMSAIIGPRARAQ
jgi:YfiH family protein